MLDAPKLPPAIIAWAVMPLLFVAHGDHVWAPYWALCAVAWWHIATTLAALKEHAE